MVSFIPLSMSIFGDHPNFKILDISNCFLKVPSGVVVSHLISPTYSTYFAILFANCFIDKSRPVPTFKKPNTSP